MSESDELLVRARARVGTVLRGKYRLDDVLGVGGMAVVYAATHRNRKRFAVKMLHPELGLRPDICRRFLREGYAANSVEHADAVAVLDDDVDEHGVAFLVMELLDGASVEELAERSGDRLPLPAVLAIGCRVLAVLAAAHAHGVIHRDVKPANIFLTRRGDVKLLDFGIARVRDVAATHRTTLSGMAMGTAGFMAPEQARGRVDDVDGRTDLWAVGATLFNLAAGRLVHQCETLEETVVDAATRPAPSLGTVLPDAPPAIVAAVDRALAFDPTNRWPSAVAMREALHAASLAAYGDVGPLPALPAPKKDDAWVTSSPFVPQPSPAFVTVRPRKRWRLVAIGAASVAVVAVVAARHRPEIAAPPAPPSSTAASLAPVPAPVVERSEAPGVASTTVVQASARAKAPAVRAPARPPRCSPPFYFDGQGNRVFKEECL